VLLQEIPEDDELRVQWDALVEKTDRPQIFYTYEWALAVGRTYSETLKPLLFLAYDARDSLCGVAALAVSPGQGRVSFLCATTGDYCDFISSPEYKADFVAALFAELNQRGTKDMVFTNLPADSDSVMALKQASQQQHLHCFARTAYICAQISLESLECDTNGRLVVPRKKMVRRFLNVMGRDAPVRLDHARSWNSLQPILPQFIQEHVARFLVTGRISNLAHPERRKFLEELGQLLSTAGWMVCTRMMSGERVFAWNYGFQFHGTWFWYQPTFDSALEKYSPGFCLLSQLVGAAAQDANLQQIDMGLGAEEYKERFANQTRETLYVTLKKSSTRHFGEILRYRLSAIVKRWPVAEKRVRLLFVRHKAFRQRLQLLGVRETCIWAAKRAWSALAARDEVFFYELTSPNEELVASEGMFLKTIDLRTLAVATMQNVDDEATLAYLLRCAHRLRAEDHCVGFALTNATGELLHFTWAHPFENFYWAELNSILPSPAPDSIVLFDSWTPVSQRGRGHYGPTLGLVVRRIQREGKRSWGFSASTNTSSVRGLEKAGFRRRFSIVRYRLLWWQKLIQKDTAVRGANVAVSNTSPS
jgi:CelD/BcsL family acetyltransferase involved in cellulose biosynthesis